MTTEQIKKVLNLSGAKRLRKIKDNDGNFIREFRLPNEYSYIFVKTDPNDNEIIFYDMLESFENISIEDLKDTSMPWAKYVFCCQEQEVSPENYDKFIFITPFIYWRDNSCMYDGSILTRFLPKELGEEMEATFSVYPDCGKTADDVIKQMKDCGIFIEDEEFKNFMNTMQ